MGFDPGHLFALAQELDAQARQAGNGKAAGLLKARFRAAISRAYYAAFWSARHYFETAKPPQRLSRLNPHWELQELFGRYSAQSMTEIARGLQRLHALRNRADYDLNVPQLEDEAARALRLANCLLNAIGNLPADPTQIA